MYIYTKHTYVHTYNDVRTETNAPKQHQHKHWAHTHTTCVIVAVKPFKQILRKVKNNYAYFML